MKTDFTPGPWYRGHGERLPQGVLHPLLHLTIAICAKDALPSHFPTEDSEREANANLIAAAPELYEALSIFMEHGDLYDAHGQAVARLALAKARGLPPGAIGTCAIVDNGAQPPSHPYPKGDGA